jgi:hypothetical protein
MAVEIRPAYLIEGTLYLYYFRHVIGRGGAIDQCSLWGPRALKYAVGCRFVAHFIIY